MADVIEVLDAAHKIVQPAHAICAEVDHIRYRSKRTLDPTEHAWAQSCGICLGRFDGEPDHLVKARK